MIQIAVCSESEDERTIMKEYLAKYEEECHLGFCVAEYGDVGDLLRIHGKPYDMLFVDIDIEVGRETGISMAKSLRAINEEVIMAIMSENGGHASDAYDMNAEEFLLKPLSFAMVEKALRRNLCQIRDGKEKVVIRFNGNTNVIRLESIVYVEYYSHKLTFHLMNGNRLYKMGGLKEFLREHGGEYLCLVNKNCIVNKLWVESYDKKAVRLKGRREDVEISRQRWKIFEIEYLRFCGEGLP